MKRYDVTLGQWTIPLLSIMMMIGLVLLQYSVPIHRDMRESGPPGEFIGWIKPYNDIGYWLIGLSGIGIIGYYVSPILWKNYEKY